MGNHYVFLVLLTIFSEIKGKSLHKNQKEKNVYENDPRDPYDEEFANRTLMFAYGAYCGSSSLQTWTCKWCQQIPNFEVTYVETKDELQVFVGYDVDADQIVVSFRGTHNAIDWLDDLDMTKVSYPGVAGGEVHQGFYEAWKILKTGVMNATTILMDLYFNTPILLTGHSLGAALAYLAVLDIKSYANETNNDCQVNTYTYGSPRWGNLIMAQYFSFQVNENWRLVNHHDVVPTVPPKHDGFHHTCTEVWYTEYNPMLQYQICNDSGEDKNCSYIERSAEDHLWYLDVHESCD